VSGSCDKRSSSVDTIAGPDTMSNFYIAFLLSMRHLALQTVSPVTAAHTKRDTQHQRAAKQAVSK
jgi:hypothetical protein